MIRDWGLWELTDEDWHGFVSVGKSQKQQDRAAPPSQGEESLAPHAEDKASDRASLLQEGGELESTITPLKNTATKIENLKSNHVNAVEEENPQPSPFSQHNQPISSPIIQAPVQGGEKAQEENLEPIRVTSPKTSQPVSRPPQTTLNVSTPVSPDRERLQKFVQPATPVSSSPETGFETVEVKEEAIAPPPGIPSPISSPISSLSQDLKPASSSHVNTEKKATSPTALKVGDLNITTEEIIPLLEKYQLLPRLIREIIIDRALLSIDCSSEELTKATEKFYQQQQVQSPQQLQAWLRQKQSSIEQVQNAIARGIKLDKFKEQMWSDRVEPYFLERKLEFDKVLYSLLRTQDLGVAQELYFRILEEEAEFSNLAKDYSQGVESKTGGVVGPISLSKIHPTLKEMFQRSKPGQLWSPQYIDNWFVVVRLEQFVPATLDSEIRQKLLDECLNQWLQEQYQQVVI